MSLNLRQKQTGTCCYCYLSSLTSHMHVKQQRSCAVVDALMRMLNLHSTSTASRDQVELYKVLILDKFCKDIIAPLLRVSELRSQGVTLHLLLEQERQQIPDVPAVYFLQPTAENIEKVIQDAAQQLYDVMHINFVTTAPTRLLEQLATGAIKANAVGKVAKLYDEYLSFIALEPTFFSLGLPDCYLQLNDPSARDSQIEVQRTCMQVTRVCPGACSIVKTQMIRGHTISAADTHMLGSGCYHTADVKLFLHILSSPITAICRYRVPHL